MYKQTLLLSLVLFLYPACRIGDRVEPGDKDREFTRFEDRFLDAYWKEYPSFSIAVGYGKYYENLVIPDSASVAGEVAFSGRWLDSLDRMGYEQLSDNNKISSKIIRNQLESDIWYRTVFKEQEWDPSLSNLSADCDYIVNQPYAPLDERLRLLTSHLRHADDYYRAALQNLHRPVKEYVQLSIQQNQGGLDVLGAGLTDSIKTSHLSEAEKDSLRENVGKTIKAINGYVDALKAIVADKKYLFRDFRIGKALFAAKFKYDLATDLTPEQVYEQAAADKAIYHRKMFILADSLWPTYYGKQPKPGDSLRLVQLILYKIQLNHARPMDFRDSVSRQLDRLNKFIVDKGLFDFDPEASPIKVRLMPVYERGVVVASAEVVPPYQKKGTGYYNVDDLTLYDPQKAEGALRECNNYASQLLTIHEAVPGHGLQGIYNNKRSPDVLRSVFQNSAMVEGWAVYTEGMMLENGWGNHSPELELMLCKWRLRELGNVLIDYSIQCRDMSEEAVMTFLVKECFQTDAQAREKYHRATVSQVQLCSYYTGYAAIQALREDFRKKRGERYTLKDFHERFLSFGSSPVKYIRERMLQ